MMGSYITLNKKKTFSQKWTKIRDFYTINY